MKVLVHSDKTLIQHPILQINSEEGDKIVAYLKDDFG